MKTTYNVQIEFAFECMGLFSDEELKDIKESLILDLSKDFHRAEDFSVIVEKR